MKLSVKGKQIDVGDALRAHVETHLNEAVSKYFGESSLEATVGFSREGNLFRADITVHAARGILLQSNATASEAPAAFDSALTRLAGRLRRHKNKIKTHSHEATRGQVEAMIASSFVLHGDTHEEEVNDNPAVIAEMTTPVETLTVGQAVMRLDLGDLPALLFRNSGNGGLNMIYRRPDGNIGWVDPAETAAVRKAQ